MKKLVLILVIVTLVSWAGNYYYFQQQQLNGAFFLKHYYEITNSSSGNLLHFDLYYVENVSENNPVTNINVHEEFVTINNPLYSVHDSTNIVQSYSHQLLKKMSFRTLLSDSVALSKILEKITITEVEVTYKNGSTEIVDIGEIRFMEWEAPSETGQAPIDLVGVAGYDNQLSKYEFRVNKDILLIDVESNFNHQMKRDFQFYINDHEELFESLPLTIESNRLSITIKTKEEEYDPFSVYDFKPKLIYETTEGDLGFARFHHVQQSYLSEEDIKELLKEER